MPRLKTRSQHTKVYRPNGTLYAEGKHAVFAVAVHLAISRFADEFARYPRQDQAVLEIVGSSLGWSATVFEVRD
jgi:hypothetical protein